MTSPLPTATLEALRRLVAEQGPTRAAELVGVNETTLVRAYAGLAVQAGTAALVERVVGEQEKR